MHKIRRALIALVLVVAGAVFVFSQGAAHAPAVSAGQQRKTSEPYTGDLTIFDSPGRDERLQINRVMDILGIAPGKSVADIGAGSGWFTVRAARRVGEGGMVYAVDINPEAIQYIENRVKENTLRMPR